MRSLTLIVPSDLSLHPERMNALDGAAWTRGADFKKAFRLIAMERQFGFCGYCCAEIGDEARNSPDIEHFADKTAYPDWAFELQNLLLSCKYCNQKRKGRFNTVIVKSAAYESCCFALIHPYLDNASDHVRGGFFALGQEPSVPTPRTLKGLRTIRLFRLNTAGTLKMWLRIHNDMLAKQQMDAAEVQSYERAKKELSGYAS